MARLRNGTSRALALSESIDGFRLKPTLRDQFFRERGKFRHQASKPSLRHMTRVARELADTQDFDPSTNPWTRPTIGKDGEASWYDPNPQARISPIFKHRLTNNAKIGEMLERLDTLTEAFPSKDKDKSKEKDKGQDKGQETSDKKGAPPAFLKKKKTAPPDQEAVQQQGQQQDAQDQQMLQQQNKMMQQQGLPPGQMSPQDAMAGGMAPELPELPGDVRKDPSWRGNRSAGITKGLETYSQKVADRYDISKDVMAQNPGPRTFSHRMRMQQVRFGDMTNRDPKRTQRLGSGGE